ncbi:NAD(P)-dependent oxidoreductase [Streptomyces sp. TS71-3]|uniref:NAD(P)-dependent oxidoreductase n=1 Tax=Streptomyces sp. TS71-3 TaxID=2733862 RepID=UPI001B2968F9|nr:NAD(P)-dependent oxidoreductase [Streptomyces sp. TS71-3]GHJ38477.1 dehydrogenase [Streptomyces sp. TS71-3]
MSPDSRAVGFIGLGAMGGRMAARLLAAGHRVHGWNRSSDRLAPLTAAGLEPCATPREVAARAGTVLVMVWDSEALLAVTEGPDGLLSGMTGEHVLVDLSTVEPHVSRQVAARVRERGGRMLDCPVSGSLDAAEAGTLVLLAGGPSGALDRLRPTLEVLAERIIHLGEDNGLGLAMKLAVNLQVALQAVAWGEAMVVAEDAGIDRAAATEAMLASVIASPMLRYRAPFLLREPAEVWASAAQLRKDVAYATSGTGGRTPSGDLALRLLDAVCAAGDGDREAAQLMRHVADCRGTGPAEGSEA